MKPLCRRAPPRTRRAGALTTAARPAPSGNPPLRRRSAVPAKEREGIRMIGRAANRFPRAPKELIPHNSAQFRTFAHNSALFRTQPRGAGRPAQGRWPCESDGRVRGGRRRRGRKGGTAARRGGRAMAVQVRPRRKAVSMRPLKRRNGVSGRGPWAAPGDGTRDGRTAGSESRAKRLAETRTARESDSDYPARRLPSFPRARAASNSQRSRRSTT